MAKFKVGDTVTVNGAAGEVVEVAAHDQHWLGSQPQMYSVRLTPWVRETVVDANGNDQVRYAHPDGETDERGRVKTRGHEADTLGGVPETAIKGHQS